MRVRVLATVLFGITAMLGAPSLGPAGGPAPASAQTPPDDADGIIVKFRSDATLADVGSALEASDTVATASTGGSKLVFVDPEPGQSMDGALSDLAADDAVEFAEPDAIVSIAATPNDTYYAAYQQWHYDDINLPAAWDTTTGDTSVIVAVIDTGVLKTHPDLDGKLTTGANAGWDFYNGDNDPNDDNGHGTFVAGIVAAETNNNSWVSGVCWTCKIMSVKALGPAGTGPTSAVVSGIDHAVANGADVINLSLGSASGTLALETAVNNAYAAGVTVVGASGNTGAPVLFPAAYDNVIAVGATGTAGTRESWSNFGPELDVMAPGGDVVSTIRTSAGGFGFGSGSGTSFAAPHVAGVAGLMVANGITDPDDIAARLKTTATDLETGGFDNLSGYGRINAAAALAGDTEAPVVSIVSPASGATVSGYLTITAAATDDGGLSRVRFWIDNSYLGYDTSAPYNKQRDTSAWANGPHTLKVQAEDAAGNFSAYVTIPIVIDNSDTTPPVASITSPSNGASVFGVLPITAAATDGNGIRAVRFFIDGTYVGYDSSSPYVRNWDTRSYADGEHVIEIHAYDRSDNITTAVVTVNIANGPDTTAPSVSVTGPANGSIVSGLLTITAAASDDRGISRIRFWIDDVYQGYDLSSPYNKQRDSTVLADGLHTIKVQAEDNSGNFSPYASITVVVDN